ncbi:MAG TPA: hypothetical protein VM327_03285 [Candidatus Thermoplasmatota archaeon]|nr:hypothetical protein [Candidatus Thermoplasmatota archaeon]
MRNLLLIGSVCLLLLPTAQAHAAPDPLDNEVHLLADGGDDTYAYTGGLDLQDLFAREAWHRPTRAEGVIFRMIVYGSVGPAGAGGPLRLTLDWESPGGGGSLALSSTDGTTYTAEGATLVEASMESEGSAVQGSIQVFVPSAALGAGRGQSIEGWAWSSWVGEDLRDVAPGGKPLPGSQGAVMAPEESTTVTPSLALQGPRGYTRSAAAMEEGAIRIGVQNLITTTGQHIMVELPAETPGWTLGEPEPAGVAVNAGEHPSFQLTATAGNEAGPLTLYVTSDLGGREAIVIQAGAPSSPDSPANGDTNAPSGEAGKDSPGLPFIALLGLLAIVVSVRRRS